MKVGLQEERWVATEGGDGGGDHGGRDDFH